jgi:hypothetical protein
MNAAKPAALATDILQKARRFANPGRPATLLMIDQTGGRVYAIQDDSSTSGGASAIGTLNIGLAPFKSATPRPVELENAIAVIENALMPLRKLLPPSSTFLLAGDGVATIAQSAGLAADGDLVLSLEQVEEIFRDLAAVSEGRPVTSSRAPIDRKFTIAILALREFMHHLSFDSVRLLQ